MRLGIVIPVGPGRQANLEQVLEALGRQTYRPAAILIVQDGPTEDGSSREGSLEVPVLRVRIEKHRPGDEQPRNVGVRCLVERIPDVSHVHFLDSDVIVGPDCLEHLVGALEQGPEDRIVVAPYDWLPFGIRGPLPQLSNDPRWPSFEQYDPPEVRYGDLAAGLACFSGNLLWPIDRFIEVGGFWNELHHGRCEDGELGLRAVAMGVGISFAKHARGWHLWHPVDMQAAMQRNARDVPMLNDRHPWVQQGGVLMVDRDGKAFDVRCPGCQSVVPTIGWWEHATACGGLDLPVR